MRVRSMPLLGGGLQPSTSKVRQQKQWEANADDRDRPPSERSNEADQHKHRHTDHCGGTNEGNGARRLTQQRNSCREEKPTRHGAERSPDKADTVGC